MKNSFLFIHLLAILAGCATAGHQFNMNATNQIKIGTSTKNDVVAILGNPSSEFIHGDGHLFLNYNDVHILMGFLDSPSFTVTIAPDGRVVNTYKHTTNQ